MHRFYTRAVCSIPKGENTQSLWDHGDPVLCHLVAPAVAGSADHMEIKTRLDGIQARSAGCCATC